MFQKADFPILKTKINGHSLIYFDNAGTAQKPQVVFKAEQDFYFKANANTHNSLNPLGEEAAQKYTAAQKTIADFMGASSDELLFTASATFGINMVARTWGEANLKAGDIVVLSMAEHHANIVPWLQLKEKKKIILKYITLDKNGGLDIKMAERLLSNPRVKLLSFTAVSNVLGISNPVTKLIKLAKAKKITTLLDISQSIMHAPVNAHKLGADFLVFSGHKLYGPMGIGVLYVRREILRQLPIFFGGGGMIKSVKTNYFIPLDGASRFAAGTPNVAGVIALAAACQYLNKLGWSFIKTQEKALSLYLSQKLRTLDFVKILGKTNKDIPLYALTFSHLHPHDVADLLGEEGIITRAGHHCAEPLHDYYNLPATLRLSLCFYNTKSEIDVFIASLKKIQARLTI